MSITPWTMRAALVGAVLACGLLPCIHDARASDQDTRRVYDEARVCFVANGHVSLTFKDSGDSANAARFDANAKRAFDASYYFGHMLGLSDEQVANDLDAESDRELPKLMRRAGYLTEVAKKCKRVGLM